jgi:hypothetical protein
LLQSSTTGCGTPVAVFAGDTSDGAEGVCDAGGLTVSAAVRVTLL